MYGSPPHPRPRPWLVPLAFLALAVALRWGSFFISVIGHDESTYIVIADELLRGEVYLRDVIDTKPIGIFWIYAGLIKLTGGSIPLLRLAVSAVLALGAWGLYVANYRATGERVAGYVAGAAYLFMCSIFTDYGIGPNTEHFFNTCTIWAVALGVASPRKQWFPAGLLLGIAFIIKPFAAAEALAVGLYLVWYYARDARYGRVMTAGLILVAGFALPVVGVVAYYAWLGLLDALWFYTFEVAQAYPIELPWYLRLKYMADYLLRYAPFLLLGGVARVGSMPGKALRAWNYYLLLQFLLVTAIVLTTGKRFGHYQVQLHPALALWCGAWVGFAWREVVLRRWVVPAVAAVAIAIGLAHALYYHGKEDVPREIAGYFRPRIAPGEEVFLMNGHQIAYHLLDRPSPTPYVHSSLLYYDHHVNALGIDLDAVARQLIDNPSLVYLLGRVDDPELDTPLTDRLLEHFEEHDRIGEEFIVYRRVAVN